MLPEPRLDPVGIALAQLLRPRAVADVELTGRVTLDPPRQLLQLDPQQALAFRRARLVHRQRLADDHGRLRREQAALGLVDRARDGVEARRQVDDRRLSEPPDWRGDGRLGRTAIVHLTPGLDGVSRAVNEAERGLLPAEATVVVGQPTALDPSRAPAGGSILWIQLQEVPSRPKGDAAGELDTGDGAWTDELREGYADRIQARIASHVPNLESAILRRVAFSPADIAAANPNMPGGDIYSGSCALDQNLLWRPRPGLPGHRTHVEGLWHIGASTHPGPGLGAGSGTLVAKELLRPKLGQRLRVPKSIRSAE